MSKSPFDLFIDLITFDQALHVKEKKIIALETVVEDFEDQLEAVQKAFEQEQALVRDLKKKVDLQELEMKTLDEKAKLIQERFSAASNNKEYLALKKENEEIQQLQMDAESALITAWNNLENAQKAVVIKEKAYHAQKKEIDSKVEEQQKIIDELEAQFQAESKDRLAKETGVPEEWVEKYERMRNAVPDPVASVEDHNCKACFYRLTDQEMIKLARKKLLQCKGCYRFLYIAYASQAEGING